MRKPIEALLGKTLTSITVHYDCITFKTYEGNTYKMYHNQDGYEYVYVEDIIGDVIDLLDSPILVAEERTSDRNPDDITKEYQDHSFTWTFYELATIKGSVTIRWYGESSGYYSESVEFIEV